MHLLLFMLSCFVVGHGSNAWSVSPPQRLSTRQLAGWSVGQAVNTTSGPVSGHGAANLTDVSEYLGIPYAEPPLGSLRFQPPVRYEGTTPINGTEFGPSCLASSITGNATVDPSVYANITVTPIAVGLMLEINEWADNQSEDCLTLNIWTKPQTGEEGKAVMVWIHGGAYVSGGSAVEWYNGQYLAGKEDVIVVSINYRLSIFGFPGNPLSRPNLGLLDQRLAVEWVRDNIGLFGGDPARITLFGQSAGGASVDLYSYAWADDAIARAFIPMSGTATGFGLPTNLTANANWFNATAAAGCGGFKDDHQRVYACMMGKTGEEIARNIPANTVADSGAGLPFGPVVDEAIVFSNYNGRKAVEAPMLIGNTHNETGLFRIMAPTIPESVLAAVNDNAFTCPAALRAAESVLQGNPTWRYRYFGVFPNMVLSVQPESGAWHTSEVPVLFNATPSDLLPDTPEEAAIGSYLRRAWATFAKDPYNGLTELGWPEYTTTKKSLVRLGYDNQTGPNLAVGNKYDSACQSIPVIVVSATTTVYSVSTAVIPSLADEVIPPSTLGVSGR
ncbi:carboxylesterase [Coniochaeta sp. 2T2.1]|nr:carboxylesterase [Coniochaeta sp. 2T2.1]